MFKKIALPGVPCQVLVTVNWDWISSHHKSVKVELYLSTVRETAKDQESFVIEGHCGHTSDFEDPLAH